LRRYALVLSIGLLLVSTVATAGSYVPKVNSREAVKKYVEAAAKVVAERGADACATLSTTEWRGGDYYILVAGPDGTVLCHPSDDLIGKPQAGVINSRGEKVGEMVEKMVAEKGKGWVEYYWKRSGRSEEEIKSTYVMGVSGPDGKVYTVGAGGWDLKK
jgi:signal transduction histidine kinase